MRGYSRTLVTMCALILVMSFAGAAFAQDQRGGIMTATNNSGDVRTDLHVVFAGTGGNIDNAVITADGGTGAGVISVVGGGNEILIDWAPNNIPIGAAVTFEFTVPRALTNVGVSEARWTPDDVLLPPADWSLTWIPKVPSLSQWGLVALLMLLIGAAFFVVRRRRCVPTA